MVKTISGDIINLLEETTGAYFVHQVNCKRVAGAGLAAQFRKRVPGWFDDYVATEPELGSIHVFPYMENYVVNLYGQNSFGYDRMHTDYGALGVGLVNLADMLKEESTLYFPYGMGAGLGGGDWELISSIIEAALQEHNIIYVRK